MMQCFAIGVPLRGRQPPPLLFLSSAVAEELQGAERSGRKIEKTQSATLYADPPGSGTGTGAGLEKASVCNKSLFCRRKRHRANVFFILRGLWAGPAAKDGLFHFFST